MTATSTTVYYFGCIDQPGHYFWSDDHRMAKKAINFSEMPGGIRLNVDGAFTPLINRQQGSAALITFEGWTILAWHDYTCDKRPGSNSAILVKGDLSLTEVMELLQVKFPSVYKRQTAPITVLGRA